MRTDGGAPAAGIVSGVLPLKRIQPSVCCPAEGEWRAKTCARGIFSFRTEFPMPLQFRHLRCRGGAGAYANLWCSVGTWRRIGNQNAAVARGICRAARLLLD